MNSIQGPPEIRRGKGRDERRSRSDSKRMRDGRRQRATKPERARQQKGTGDPAGEAEAQVSAKRYRREGAPGRRNKHGGTRETREQRGKMKKSGKRQGTESQGGGKRGGRRAASENVQSRPKPRQSRAEQAPKITGGNEQDEEAHRKTRKRHGTQDETERGRTINEGKKRRLRSNGRQQRSAGRRRQRGENAK